jgi:hypothetical protein
MRILSERFDKNGFRHEQIKRSDKAAIYKRWKPGGSVHFEVVMIKRATRDFAFPSGVVIENGSEIYPSSEEWGVYGWTFREMETAVVKFNQIG